MVKKTAAKKTLSATPLTSPKIKSLAGKALRHPEKLSIEETQELGGSVMEHIKRKAKKS